MHDTNNNSPFDQGLTAVNKVCRHIFLILYSLIKLPPSYESSYENITHLHTYIKPTAVQEIFHLGTEFTLKTLIDRERLSDFRTKLFTYKLKIKTLKYKHYCV